MFLLVTVSTDSIIIEAGIFDQSNPFAPPRWNVAAIVLVEVLAKEGCGKRRKKVVKDNHRSHMSKPPESAWGYRRACVLHVAFFPTQTSQHCILTGQKASLSQRRLIADLKNRRPCCSSQDPTELLNATPAHPSHGHRLMRLGGDLAYGEMCIDQHQWNVRTMSTFYFCTQWQQMVNVERCHLPVL